MIGAANRNSLEDEGFKNIFEEEDTKDDFVNSEDFEEYNSSTEKEAEEDSVPPGENFKGGGCSSKKDTDINFELIARICNKHYCK